MVNYGSHHLLRTFLGALPAQPGRLVVVVDNDSGPQERAAVRELAAEYQWHVVSRPNDGFGAGVNAGVRAAIERGAHAVLVLNPDAAVTNEVAEALLADALAHPGDLISPLIRQSDGRLVFRGSELDLRTGHLRSLPIPDLAPDRDILTDPGPDRVPWLTGACLAMHRDVVQRTAGFDERYFMYWEDVDFSLRARQAGVRLVLRRDLTVLHDEGGTQGERPSASRAKSDLYYYYNCRNRLLFAKTWLSRAELRPWLLRTPRESAQIWLRGGRRQLLDSPGGAWSAVRGSVSGILSSANTSIGRDRPAGGRQ